MGTSLLKDPASISVLLIAHAMHSVTGWSRQGPLGPSVPTQGWGSGSLFQVTYEHLQERDFTAPLGLCPILPVVLGGKHCPFHVAQVVAELVQTFRNHNLTEVCISWFKITGGSFFVCLYVFNVDCIAAVVHEIEFSFFFKVFLIE